VLILKAIGAAEGNGAGSQDYYGTNFGGYMYVAVAPVQRYI